MVRAQGFHLTEQLFDAGHLVLLEFTLDTWYPCRFDVICLKCGLLRLTPLLKDVTLWIYKLWRKLEAPQGVSASLAGMEEAGLTQDLLDLWVPCLYHSNVNANFSDP